MTARYPFVGYQVRPWSTDGTLELDIDGDVDTITIGTASTVRYGYSVLAPAVGTTVALLATALATHSHFDPTPPTFVATYASSTSMPAPRWSISTASAGVDVDITVTDGDPAVLDALGLRVGDTATIVSLTTSWTATRRWLGLWSPGDEAAIMEPEYVDLGAGTSNPYDPSYADRYRMGRQLTWAAQWPMVEAADISRELVEQDPGLQGLGNRETDDTLGTLDDLLGAAGSGRLMRLVLGANEQREVRMLDEGTYRRGAYTTRTTYGGRRYEVAFGLIETLAYAGVTT